MLRVPLISLFNYSIKVGIKKKKEKEQSWDKCKGNKHLMFKNTDYSWAGSRRKKASNTSDVSEQKI